MWAYPHCHFLGHPPLGRSLAPQVCCAGPGELCPRPVFRRNPPCSAVGLGVPSRPIGSPDQGRRNWRGTDRRRGAPGKRAHVCHTRMEVPNCSTILSGVGRTGRRPMRGRPDDGFIRGSGHDRWHAAVTSRWPNSARAATPLEDSAASAAIVPMDSPPRGCHGSWCRRACCVAQVVIEFWLLHCVIRWVAARRPHRGLGPIGRRC